MVCRSTHPSDTASPTCRTGRGREPRASRCGTRTLAASGRRPPSPSDAIAAHQLRPDDCARMPRRLLTFPLAVLVATTVCAATVPAALPADAQETPSLTRRAGDDRVATAVAVSREHWVDGAETALLATATDFPDALAAVALAGRLDAPLLLTWPDRLDDAVADELQRLGAGTVVVLGGEEAVGGRVERQLGTLGIAVDRVSGADRYATARALALRAGPSGNGEVALALGEHPDPDRAWPDAVSAGALAATPERVPTLLTRAGGLPDATLQALEELEARRVVIIGGVITGDVAERLRGLGYEVVRLAGVDRYDTASRVATIASRRQADDAPLVVATGADFADALSGGALAAHVGGALVLVRPGWLGDEVNRFVRRADFDAGVVLGGADAIRPRVVRALQAAITGEPRPQPPAPPAPEPEPTPEPEPATPPGPDTRFPIATWDALADCESGGRWDINTGNGYYGGLQFSLSSWRAVGGQGYPHQATKTEQIERADQLQAMQGWGAWPACSRQARTRGPTARVGRLARVQPQARPRGSAPVGGSADNGCPLVHPTSRAARHRGGRTRAGARLSRGRRSAAPPARAPGPPAARRP